MAAVVSQQLVNDESLKNQPIQIVLIYPQVLIDNQRALPSALYYHDKGLPLDSLFTAAKAFTWYLGIDNSIEEVEEFLRTNSHYLLLEESERKKFLSFLDVEKIPAEYKKDRTYYETHTKYILPEMFDDNSLFHFDPLTADNFKQLFLPELSPLFADHEVLTKLPKTYAIVLEWDILKGSLHVSVWF